MTAITQILVGTDLSEPARFAVDRAAALAESLGARMTLVHVVQQRALERIRELLGQQGGPVEASIVREAEADLAALAAELRASEAVRERIVSVGAPVEQLIAEADARDASVVVVGSRGEGLVRDIVLGSTAERLVRKTPRPVLVVRSAAAANYRRVLVPVDFSPASPAAIALAQAIAPDAELVLFHAVSVPFEGKLRFAGVDVQAQQVRERRKALDRLARLAADAGLAPDRHRRVATPGDAVTQILAQAEDDEVDLIVLGKHGRNAAEALLLGSVTKHVLTAAGCDLLISEH